MRKSTIFWSLTVFGFFNLCIAQECSKSVSSLKNGDCVYYKTYVTEAITDDLILPKKFVGFPFERQELKVTACRGEYEPATFSVCALEEIKGLTVTATELKSGKNIIPVSAVDICVVKCWFQSGVEMWEADKRLLIPELLLKDDSLVKVDIDKKENYLRCKDSEGKEKYVHISGSKIGDVNVIRPVDAKTLQPVDIAKETIKQFWVTVHVPEDSKAGEYVGKIKLTAANAPASEMSIRVRVLGFKLEESILRYSIYYRGRLTEDNKGSISSEEKSRRQYEAEMRDMKAHGVLYPTSYQGYDEKLLAEMFEIRENAGLPKGTFYNLGTLTGNPESEEKLEALKNEVKLWREFVKKYGYDEMYIYGLDEAVGERLKSQRAAWHAVHQAGGKVFVAAFEGGFELVGDLLDLAIHGGEAIDIPDTWPYRNGVIVSYDHGAALRPKEAEKYHKAGNKIFCYGNPQVGMEKPETYRRNFGLLLWKAGYDGAMNYAYQHSFGHIWNDFDLKAWRDHTFTYPTVDGVISTIEWEGWREGVDDIRYLSTLLKAIEKAKTTKPKLAGEAQKWVEAIDPKDELDILRAKMVEWILQLK